MTWLSKVMMMAMNGLKNILNNNLTLGVHNMRDFNEYNEAKDIIDLANEYEIEFNSETTLSEIVSKLQESNWTYEFSVYYVDLLGNLTVDHLTYIYETYGEGLTRDNTIMVINDAMLQSIVDMYGDKLVSYFKE